jgi:adenine-specific DNA-methyltransferase
MREANLKGYSHLYVIGFAIEPNARLLNQKSTSMGAIPTTYVQATRDLLMGDLLKNMRSSQIFSVCGLPAIEVKKHKGKGKNGARKYQVSLLGLDVFDPVTMDTIHSSG